MDGLYGINEYIESSFLLLISRQVVVISPNSKGCHSGGRFSLPSKFHIDFIMGPRGASKG